MDTNLLVEIVKESEWWVRFSAWSDAFREKRKKEGLDYCTTNEEVLRSWITDRNRLVSSYTAAVSSLAHEFLDLLGEIESGLIYGGTECCCVCGKSGGTGAAYDWAVHDWIEFKDGKATGVATTIHCCRDHWPTSVVTGVPPTTTLPAAGAILRARRVLGNKGVPGLAPVMSPEAAKPTSTEINRWVEILTDHACWDHPYWSEPGHVSPIWRCTAIERALEALDVCGSGSYNAVRAAIREVKSGEVFGSSSRCAVCGKGSGEGRGAVYREAYRPIFYRHDLCYIEYLESTDTCGMSEDELTKTIFTGRKRYREASAKSADGTASTQVPRPREDTQKYAVDRVIRNVPCRIDTISWTNNDRGTVSLHDETTRWSSCSIGGDSSYPVNQHFDGPVRITADFMPTIRGWDLVTGETWTVGPEPSCGTCQRAVEDGEQRCKRLVPSRTCDYYPRRTVPTPDPPPVHSTPVLCWDRSCRQPVGDGAVTIDGHAFCEKHGEAARKWYTEQDRLVTEAQHDLDRPVWKGFERVVQTGDLHGPTLDPSRRR